MLKKILLSLLFSWHIFHTVAQQNTSTVSNTIDTVQRVLPSPIISPPFPGSEWDGGPIIGAPNDDKYFPFQKLVGLADNKNRIRFYGWVDVGGDISTSKHSNAPTAYD